MTVDHMLDSCLKKNQKLHAENEVLRKALELACDSLIVEWDVDYFINQARQAIKTGA